MLCSSIGYCKVFPIRKCKLPSNSKKLLSNFIAVPCEENSPVHLVNLKVEYPEQLVSNWRKEVFVTFSIRFYFDTPNYQKMNLKLCIRDHADCLYMDNRYTTIDNRYRMAEEFVAVEKIGLASYHKEYYILYVSVMVPHREAKQYQFLIPMPSKAISDWRTTERTSDSPLFKPWF